MQLIRSLDTYMPARPLALAIGNFDGLHRGHAQVIGRMLEVAARENYAPAILTFEPHPRRFFTPDAPSFRLQTLHDKLAMLRAMGVEYVFALRFNRAMASVDAPQFLQELLYERMQVRAVITGEDFIFGKGRGGDVPMLRQWGAAQGVITQPVSPVEMNGAVCSSTAVRAALEAGDMDAAAVLLGRRYSLSGPVRHGDKRGREWGYPTANILPSVAMKLPRFGIYAVRASHGASRWDGVANLGVRPMFASDRSLLEVHLFDYAGDLYGKRLKVDFMTHLRDEKRFDTIEALTHQIALDAAQARQSLQEQA